MWAAAGLCALACSLAAVPSAFAADAKAKTDAKPAAKTAGQAKPAAKGRKAVKAAPPVAALAAASPEQLDAAERVFYGVYDCEFKQSIEISADEKNTGYVDVKHAKAAYKMKPVLSTTGAIRLEDVKGQMLMVQIAQKSMLMDVKVGHRVVDDCVSPKQRELMEAARAQKAAEAASAAAATSAPDNGLSLRSAAPAASAASGI
jgi:hypothetical protein